jgi:hypothetical protein
VAPCRCPSVLTCRSAARAPCAPCSRSNSYASLSFAAVSVDRAVHTGHERHAAKAGWAWRGFHAAYLPAAPNNACNACRYTGRQDGDPTRGRRSSGHWAEHRRGGKRCFPNSAGRHLCRWLSPERERIFLRYRPGRLTALIKAASYRCVTRSGVAPGARAIGMPHWLTIPDVDQRVRRHLSSRVAPWKKATERIQGYFPDALLHQGSAAG